MSNCMVNIWDGQLAVLSICNQILQYTLETMEVLFRLRENKVREEVIMEVGVNQVVWTHCSYTEEQEHSAVNKEGKYQESVYLLGV